MMPYRVMLIMVAVKWKARNFVRWGVGLLLIGVVVSRFVWPEKVVDVEVPPPIVVSCKDCASPRITVHAIAQAAPVEIVSVTPSGHNLLAHVLVKNMTDRAVQDFAIAWAIIQPKNCGAAPSSARIIRMEAQGNITRQFSRPLPPRGQMQVTTLSLTREELERLAQAQSAHNLRVQIIVDYVGFRPDASSKQPYPWRSVQSETSQLIFDPEDVAQQACS
jgi:hypothetical protein